MLASFLLFNNCVQAQDKPIGVPGLVNFSRTDYQGGTQNWCIGQNVNGLMYFGNNKGLLEYDGADWYLFGLPNRTILRSFAFGNGDTLFAGGQSEFGFFKYGPGGNLYYESLVHHIPDEYRVFEDVWKVFISADEVYFCSDKAIFIWDGVKIEVIIPPGALFENFFLLNGNFYTQDKVKGLFALEDGKLKLVDTCVLFNNERIVAILPQPESGMLIVTVGQGIFRFDARLLAPWDSPLSSFVEEHQAYCAIALSDGGYAIGTSQNGLVLGSKQGDVLSKLNRHNGLQNNTVLSVFQDAQLNLWLGLDNGIAFAAIKSPFSFIGPESGIKGTGYAAAYYNDRLFLGTNQGLYSAEWNAEGEETKRFVPVVNGIGQVWNLNPVSTGLVVSQHRGASYLSGNKTIEFSDKQGAWKFMELKAHPGYAIEGTYTGFILYKKDANEASGWKFVKTLEGFFESARVFEEDSEGFIWVSHAYKGLFRLRLSANVDAFEEITRYTAEQGLPSELFINVGKIRNELVFTTPNGVYRYNRLADRFESHSDFNEIFGENCNIQRLLEDELGNIWFSIDDEFGVLNITGGQGRDGPTISYFNQLQEGLVDGFEHVFALNGQNIFIGTERGFTHYNPDLEANVVFPFGVIIRRAVSITQNDSIIYWGHQPADAEETPALHYKLNDFRFDFTSPYFEENNHLQYRFKLLGFDDEWAAWTPRTDKEYTNLASGVYTFVVQARNAYGTLSEEASFKFRVLPPWWWTIYAKILYVMLAVLALIVFISYVSKKERKKTELFKRVQTEKLMRKEAEYKKEVEKSEGEVVALRTEKLESDINHKTSQLASATMHLVQKTEMLIKLKSDLTKVTGESTADIKRKITQITRAIDSDIQLDKNWEQFEIYFDQVHENFFKHLRKKHPELTPKDQKLCAYLRMNLSTKEIAPLLNISVRGVEISRYRVRKKLGLDSDTNLVEFIMDV
jgi:DNA-binding CsgD family transcriptional regulator